MMVDGYTFYLGVNHFYQACQNLESSIYPITNLIKGAIFRSKSVTPSSGRASLNICHLGELIDMFHTHKASLAVDKVYALLGMSSDDPGAAGLLPDYEISWEKLFKKLVKFILGKDVSVETGHSQRAVIKSKGCILGQVSTVGSDERQNVDISFKNAASNFDDVMKWKLQASAKSIQKHDIICFLQGASKPTIIRLCKDYFTIIVAAVTPLNDNHRFRKQKFSRPPAHFPRDLLLVWDWEKPLRETQEEEEEEKEEEEEEEEEQQEEQQEEEEEEEEEEEDNASIKTNSQVLEYSKAKFGDYSDQATRIWNIALVFGDSKQFEIAEKRLREAIEIAFGNEQLYTLESPHGLTLLSWAAGSGYDEVVSLLFAKDSIDPDLKDPKHSRTPLSWAAENGRETVVKLLLETGKVDIDSKDSEYSRTPLSWAAGNGRETVVKLLLEKGAELKTKHCYGRTPLSWAAENGHEAVVKLLLEKGAEFETKDNLYGRTPLSWAAENGHEAVFKLLLEKGAEFETKDRFHGWTPLLWAVKNGHEAVVKLLLEKGAEFESKDLYDQTLLSWAAENGHEAVIKLLLEKGAEFETKDRFHGRTPLSWAAGNGHEAIVKLLLEKGAEFETKDTSYGRTPLLWATRNEHEAVVKLLLEKGAEFETKDLHDRTPLLWAIQNGHEAIIKLLRNGSKKS
jgi:ankyrin repeat protein